jgi:adenosylmethionine-8-amino-7-oxononanoate aminotransferase
LWTVLLLSRDGSESNESVIRLVRLYWRLRGKPDKIGIVALSNAYHGTSSGAASLTGLAGFHRYYEPQLPEVSRIPRPYCYRCELGKTYPACQLACADELEALVGREGADRVGAVIAEPVQGVGGVVVPPPGWFERIRAICDRHDLLLVVDEVITGFGRLGKPFGIQCSKVIPDMLSFAKAVTSGYQPLGGVILHERVYRVLVDAGPEFTLHHGYTYSGHPVACAAGLANLDIIEREDLIGEVRRKAPHWKRRLQSLATLLIVGEVRAAGLMGAVELVHDKDAREPFPPEAKVAPRVRAAVLRRGLIVRAGADVITLCPPLIVKRAEIDTIVRVLGDAITEVAGELAGEASPLLQSVAG